MILLPGLFNIYVDFEGNGEHSELIVNPQREHFNIISQGGVISCLKNVDKGVWQQIEGNLEQHKVSAITASIDKHYTSCYFAR
jgi:hypothetical protein